MGYLSSAESDLLDELPLFTAFDIFVFQGPVSGFAGLGVFSFPGGVCESVDRASPTCWWAVIEVPSLASGLASCLSLCDAEYVV